MLQLIRRGPESAKPIGDMPQWLSALLRARGVDTPEKAEHFLHPSLEQLHDPMLMQGMEKAVRLICMILTFLIQDASLIHRVTILSRAFSRMCGGSLNRYGSNK